LDRASEDENFPKRIIAGDETWVYGYDVKRKMQYFYSGLEKNALRPKKARRVRSKVKAMLGGVFFFYIESVVHHEFIRQRQTANHWYYLEVLKRLKRKCQREKDLSCGETTRGSSIMTVLQLMHSYLLVSIWPIQA
jgi:hypothetical protein